jgi:hypothetical protein
MLACGTGEHRHWTLPGPGRVPLGSCVFDLVSSGPSTDCPGLDDKLSDTRLGMHGRRSCTGDKLVEYP